MNLCADCNRPVGTCSWEKNFTPVNGWEARKTKLRVQNKVYVESYDVTSCPLFVPHPNMVKQRNTNARPIVATNITTGEKRYFSSIRSVEKNNDFIESAVQKCLSGKQGFHYGHTFRYADKEETT